jgi:hypothetical protein
MHRFAGGEEPICDAPAVGAGAVTGVALVLLSGLPIYRSLFSVDSAKQPAISLFAVGDVHSRRMANRAQRSFTYRKRRVAGSVWSI